MKATLPARRTYWSASSFEVDAKNLSATMIEMLRQSNEGFQQQLGELLARIAGDQHADGAVELIDRAIGLDPHSILVATTTVAKAGGSGVAGTGVNLRQPVSHRLFAADANNGPPRYFTGNKGLEGFG